jgi:hypothetical protein
MMVYAVKDLKEGDEVYFSYISLDHIYNIRCSIIQNHYGFTCNCVLCQEEQKDFLDITREQIKNQLNIEIDSLINQKNYMQALIKQTELFKLLEQTYTDDCLKYKIPLAEPLRDLAEL